MSNTNPYSSPTLASQKPNGDLTFFRRVRLAAGLLIPISLVVGVSGTVVGMIRSFNTLAESEAVDPSQLSDDISKSLSIGAIAIPLAITSFIVWVWLTIALRKRTRDACK